MATKATPKVEQNGNTNRVADKLGAAKAEKEVKVTPPKFETLRLLLIGTSPLVQHRFGEKARAMIQESQEAGSQSRKGKKREPKDFEALYHQARHISTDGWDGIHAGGFRHALVDACKLVGFFMSRGKLGLFVEADGYSADGTPLVRITKGEPRMKVEHARNTSGVVDLRSRPIWDPGWEAILTVRYDADMFSATDVVNLVARAGAQCGVGEGRANSKDSVGCGWGFFRVETSPE